MTKGGRRQRDQQKLTMPDLHIQKWKVKGLRFCCKCKCAEGSSVRPFVLPYSLIRAFIHSPARELRGAQGREDWAAYLIHGWRIYVLDFSSCQATLVFCFVCNPEFLMILSPLDENWLISPQPMAYWLIAGWLDSSGNVGMLHHTPWFFWLDGNQKCRRKVEKTKGKKTTTTTKEKRLDWLDWREREREY